MPFKPGLVHDDDDIQATKNTDAIFFVLDLYENVNFGLMSHKSVKYLKSLYKAQTTKARWTVDSMEKFGNLKLTKISKNTSNI